MRFSLVRRLVSATALCLSAVDVSAAPTLTVQMGHLDFGGKVTGEEPTRERRVTLRNTGDEDLVFSTPGVVMTGAVSDFVLSHTLAVGALPTGSSFDISLAFNPSSIGHKAAGLEIRTNDPAQPVKVLAMLGQGLSARAETISGPYTGHGPGVSGIGSGGDYASLESAVAAINSTPLTGGNWTFQILNDLVEPNNSLLGQYDTNGYSLIFRPAPNTSPVITFTTTTANLPGTFSTNRVKSGHFSIGIAREKSGGAGAISEIATNSVVIDGFATSDSTVRDLTFRNAVGAGATSVVMVFGNSDDVTIKNCNIWAVGYSHPTEQFEFAPYKASAINALPSIIGLAQDGAPETWADNLHIENCRIVTTGTVPVSAIGFMGPSGTVSSAYAPTGFKVVNNQINSNGFGIACNAILQGEFSGNSINLSRLTVPDEPVPDARGIFVSVDFPGFHPANLMVRRNTISLSDTVNAAPQASGITLNATSTNAIFTVADNLITLPGGDPSSFSRHWGIAVRSEGNCSADLIHNSVLIASGSTGLAQPSHSFGIGVSYAAVNDQKVQNLRMKNNVVRVEQPGATTVQTWPSWDVSSEHNNLSAGPQSFHGGSGFSQYMTLAEWQTASGEDLQSSSGNPLEPTSFGQGKWTSGVDLHFDSFPGEEYVVPRIDGFETDIDGDVRPVGRTVMGADQPLEAEAGISNWVWY